MDGAVSDFRHSGAISNTKIILSEYFIQNQMSTTYQEYQLEFKA